MALLHGSFDEKYEVLMRLRQGGMGAVYKVRHRLLEEVRAIKVIRSWAVGSEEAASRFLKEARVASRLRHPNLAVLYDFAVDPDGDAYLVSEFIDGWTFREILRRHGLPPLSLGLEMARQSLKALGVLHRNRIIHRDVSPDNLMLTRDVDGLPLVKLIDLGIAKALEDTAGATDAGVFLGKPRYASPEQFGGEPADERSDLYSFGVVLYELLTGRCPISGHDPLSFMAGHLSRPPLGFEESDPEGRIPDDLRKTLLDALEKRPEDRIPTAEEFAGALAAVQARYPILEADLGMLFTVPAAEEKDERDGRDSRDDREERAEDEEEDSLYLRSGESETTRSGLLPLGMSTAGPEPETSVDEVTWGAPAPPLQDGEPESSPLLFRLALSTAVLLVLFVVARGFWRPDAEQRPKEAPKWAAVPPRTAPVPPPPLRKKPAPVPATEVPKVIERSVKPELPKPALSPAPAPVIVEVTPEPALPSPPPRPRPTRSEPIAKPVPAPAVALARRVPPVWEEGDQRPGLLKPGPGVEEPVPLDFPRYTYPTAARGTGLRPDVRLALLVDERGRVIDARIREGAPPEDLGFAETALAAGKRISFQPATRYAKPGKMWTEVILEFAE